MRATQRAPALREIPIMARPSPSREPRMPEATANIRVLGKPTMSRAGMTLAISSQLKKVSASWSKRSMNVPAQSALGNRGGLAARLPVGRHLAVRVPFLGQFGPGSVGDDSVQAGVQRVDQRLVVLGHGVGSEVLRVDDGFDDGGAVAFLDLAGRLLRRGHPGVNLPVAHVGVNGGVVREADRLKLEGVGDVVILDGALDHADAQIALQVSKALDAAVGLGDDGHKAEVVAVGESD